jgi:hypothetical protein
VTNSDFLAERYGRTKERARRNRVAVISLATVLTITALTWMIASQFFSPTKVQFKTTAYEISSSNRASVNFQVLGINEPAVCAIQILDQSYAVAGYREVIIPAAKPDQSGRWVDFATTLNTIEKGVSGVVDKCWLK